jgi:hypothetical protein
MISALKHIILIDIYGEERKRLRFFFFCLPEELTARSAEDGRSTCLHKRWRGIRTSMTFFFF